MHRLDSRERLVRNLDFQLTFHRADDLEHPEGVDPKVADDRVLFDALEVFFHDLGRGLLEHFQELCIDYAPSKSLIYTFRWVAAESVRISSSHCICVDGATPKSNRRPVRQS